MKGKSPIAGLPRLRALAAAAILFERAWPALWPPLGLLGVFVVAALLDLPAMLPPAMHVALLLLFAAAIGFLTWRGTTKILRPCPAEADRRLEQSSGLLHRPLATLADNAATSTDPALWQAHQARAARLVGKLRVGLPRPGLAARDPRALRGFLVVTLAAALVIAGADAPGLLARALSPAFAGVAPPPSVQVEAWATPPAYTGSVPLFLKPGADPIPLMAGTHLTVSVTGGRTGDAASIVALDGKAVPSRTLDAGSVQADFDLSQGGTLTVAKDGRGIAAWTLAMIPAPAPTVAWASPPGPAEQSAATRLPWHARDNYALASIEAELRLRDRPDAPPLLVPISPSTTRGPDQSGVASRDLTAHPYAGLPVIARLRAKNPAGLTGESEVAEFTLPARAFKNPVARALIDARRSLSVHPDDRALVAAVLDRLIVDGPNTIGNDSAAIINLAALYSLLQHDKSAAAIDEAQKRMWSLALHLEEGAAERTQAAVDQARAEADAALEREAADPSQENREALDKALRALEQAVDEHLQALAEQSKTAEADPRAERVSPEEMRRMSEDARQAAREGRDQDAKQKLAELETKLDRLKQASRQRKPGDAARQAKRERGQEQVGALQDMVTREGGLLDQSSQRAGRLTDTADAKRKADAQMQKALRRALGEMMQQFGDLTGQVPPSLGDADTAMRDAAGALSQGQDPAASAAQKQAIAALQKGGREMSEALEKQFGPGDQGDGDDDGSGDEMAGQGDGQGSEPGDGPGGSQGGRDERGQGDKPGEGGSRPGRGGHREGRHEPRDPFGRALGPARTGTGIGEDGTQVPDEQELMRTQAIQQELRRRGADRARPDQERAYIDRLLRPF